MEGVRGQRPRHRSWGWALAWPHRRCSCRLRRLSSSRVVGHPSWYVIVVIRVHCRSRSLSFRSVVFRARCRSCALSFASVIVRVRSLSSAFVVVRGPL